MNPVEVIAKKKGYRLILDSKGYGVENRRSGGWFLRYRYGKSESKAMRMFNQL